MNYWQHERSVSFEFRFSAIVAFGLLIQTQAIYFETRAQKQILNLILILVAPITTSLLIFYCLYQGELFDSSFLKQNLIKSYFVGIICSIFSGFVTTIFYRALFHFVLREMPKSFTYGEASIVIQGFILYLTNLLFKLLTILREISNCTESSMSCPLEQSTSRDFWTSNGRSEIEQLSIMLQVNDQSFQANATLTNFILISDRFIRRNIHRWVLFFCAIFPRICLLFSSGCCWSGSHSISH